MLGNVPAEMHAGKCPGRDACWEMSRAVTSAVRLGCCFYANIRQENLVSQDAKGRNVQELEMLNWSRGRRD